MLYITTRDNTDAFTVHHTLCKDVGPYGGLYLPFKQVSLSREKLESMKDMSFGQCVADVLNLFFSARLDGWDIDFCVGRYPYRLVPMSHRIVIAETWRNPEWNFARMVRNLHSRILGSAEDTESPTNWTWIAVRIAVLFGLFNELAKLGVVTSNQKIDIAVTAGDFSAPVAVWYARKMGLPVGNIIVSCNENSAAWDLLHHGELHSNVSLIKTSTPLCDVTVPCNLERLIYDAFGPEETSRYIQTIENRGVYTITEDQIQVLREGLFGAVVSQKRMESVINSVYRTSTYILGPYSALAYGGLQDYRATTSEAGPALILTEQGPLCAGETVSRAIGLPLRELKDRLGAV